MNDDRSGLTVGVVGLGERGRNLASLVAELEHRVLGADADRDARRAFEREYGTGTYETPIELFDDQPDAVIVVGPPRFREAVSLAALERDLPIYIEKPLAHELSSAETIAAAAAESESVCMVSFHHKSVSHVEVLKSYVDDGYFGEIDHVSARQVWRRNVPHRGSWYTSNALAGGGALIDRGSYSIALVLHLLENPDVRRVLGKTWTGFGNRSDYAYIDMWGEESDEHMFDVEDSAVALVEFEDGTTMSLEVAWASNVPKQFDHSYSINGDEAGARLGIHEVDRSSLTLHETRGDVRDHHINSEVVVDEVHSQLRHLEQFFDAVERGEQPSHSTVEEALRVHRVVESIYDSST